MRRPFLLPQAVDDLQQIRKYIAQHVARAAQRVVNQIKELIQMLSRQPLLGEIREDLRPGLRSFPCGNYVIYYEPTEPRISVLRVLHGARDQEPLI